MRLPLFLLLACLACQRDPSEPLTAEELRDYQHCDAGADCVIELNGCCCDFTALSRARRDAFLAQLHCEQACACAVRPSECAACRGGLCELQRKPDGGGGCAP